VWSLAAAAALLMGLCGSADAKILIDEGDYWVRWDNTVRYNYGVRMRSPQGCFLNSPNYDDGDRNFDKGTVTNRLDIMSELDFTYKKDYGLRLSAAFWYDQRYHDALAGGDRPYSNHLVNGVPGIGLSDQAKRLYAGPDGEILDALVFVRKPIAGMHFNLSVGRQTNYWGESLLLQGGLQGISYGQMPVDVIKGLAVPGSEIKELFRPLGSVNLNVQLTRSLSLAAQQYFQWEPYRLLEGGTYLGLLDAIFQGGEINYYPLLFPVLPGAHLTKTDSPEPDGTKNFGFALRWTSEQMGTFGLYYRRFADMLPQIGGIVSLSGLQYFFSYPDDIDLYGVSYTTTIMGISVGTELSYRHNMPLNSNPYFVIPGVLPKPGKGDTYGARGNTFHGLINFFKLGGKTPLYDSVLWNAEICWTHWSHVSSGLMYFQGPGGLNATLTGPYEGLDKVTEHAVSAAVNFTPTWYQVFPGMDLSMPLSYYQGISGNGATGVVLGINENAGMWSVGLSLDVVARYKFELTYAGYFGDVATDYTGGIYQFNGAQSLLKDRDTLTFTFKTTF
jgi:hypothetical protein